jgi:hypothetical protein
LAELARAALLALVAVAGCGGSTSDDGSADGGADSRADASADCDGLSIGRCAVAGGASCSGVTSEDPSFAAVAAGGGIPLALGFQGAYMFPLAVRASGIYPGADGVPAEQPRVSAALVDGMERQVSAYSNNALMTPVAGSTDEYEWLYVFLLVPGAGDELIGDTFEVTGELVDRDGATRCGSLTFVGEAASE